MFQELECKIIGDFQRIYDDLQEKILNEDININLTPRINFSSFIIDWDTDMVGSKGHYIKYKMTDETLKIVRPTRDLVGKFY